MDRPIFNQEKIQLRSSKNILSSGDLPVYFVILLSLIVLAIREALPALGFTEILGFIKYPVAILTVLISSKAIILGWRRAGKQQRINVLSALIVVFFAIISALINPETSQLSYLAHISEWAFLTLSFTLLINKPNHVTFLLLGLLIIVLWSVLGGIWEGQGILAETNFSTDMEVGRFGGLGIDPNYFSMVMTIPFAFSFTQSMDFHGKIIKRTAYGITAAIFVFAFFWTRSRSGLISLLIMVLIIIYLKRGKGLVLSTSILLFGIFILSFVVGREGIINAYEGMIARWQALNQGTTLSRVDIWFYSLDTLFEKPVLGWGPGSMSRLINLGLYSGINNFVKPHNAWIVAAIERGLVGAGLQFLILITSFWSGAKLITAKHPVYQTLGIVLVGGVAGQFVMSLTLGGMPLGMYLITSFGLALQSMINRQEKLRVHGE